VRFPAFAILAIAVVLVVAVAPGAVAASVASAADVELADRYAPVLRLKEQPEPCGDGEPYAPVDVDWLLGNPEVGLRGPWQRGGNLVGTAPTARTLERGLPGYALDYPGEALDPGCEYEEFSDRTIAERPPTVYAHIATEPGHPSQLALQYWFFYLYNDFNNKHEGDWEMIQLLFQADSAEEALNEQPTRVGYSQHEGAEQAAWGDPKLELVGGRPVVYPAAGSHANYFGPGLFLGRSAAQGVGCDNTDGPSSELRPTVRAIPGEPGRAQEAFPWLAYEGRWGERQPSFYDGPTGPAFKRQWSEPISWADEEWRDRSFSIGAADALGPTATSFFCGAVSGGSDVLTRATESPWAVLVALAALGLAIVVGAARTRWKPSSPFRLLRRRAWGQIVTASLRLYRAHVRLFVAIGLLAIPVFAVAALLQALLFRVVGLDGLRETAGKTNAAVLVVVVGLAVLFSVLALALVQAAAAHAVHELDAGRPIRPHGAYRAVRTLVDELALADGILIAVVGLLLLSVVGIPIAVWLLGRWAYTTQVVVFEGLGGRAALRRSAELVRGHWLHSSALLLAMAGLTLLAGPLVGVALLFVTSASFDVVNVVSSLVYVGTMPLLAIATTYVYGNLRGAEATREPKVAVEALPAEAL
jgi:hypothetical protein